MILASAAAPRGRLGNSKAASVAWRIYCAVLALIVHVDGGGLSDPIFFFVQNFICTGSTVLRHFSVCSPRAVSGAQIPLSRSTPRS